MSILGVDVLVVHFVHVDRPYVAMSILQWVDVHDIVHADGESALRRAEPQRIDFVTYGVCLTLDNQLCTV